jgi:NAD(P)-dependent dehydrogenase (short-subunit alcohol dehydrogenase family)
MDTAQKVAIVTGASQGIGAGLVLAFRRRGYRVIANSRSIAASNDANIVSVAGDISEVETAKEIIETCLDRFGRLDCLVNNAGIYIGKHFTDYTAADFANALAVNLAGFFHVTQSSIAVMVRQGLGHIVSITTSLVDHAISQSPSALASLTKGGLNAATKSLAIEYAKSGIRVNAVAPGIIKTPMHPEKTPGALGRMHPLGRMGDIKDVVDAVMYLEAAPFVTGEILHVDGGQSAGH